MSEIRGNKPDLIITDELAKVYETFGTSQKAITNSNVGVIHTADDIIFPDMLPVDNAVLESIIAAGLITSGLVEMPYREDDFYHLFNENKLPDLLMGNQMYDIKTVPSPNMIHAMDARSRWPDPMYAKPVSRPPTKRQKTLKARALNKANRKRARK